jgi:hypothetical protein
MDRWLSTLGEWEVFAFLMLAFLVAAELGYRIARYVGGGDDKEVAEASAIQGAVLGLLALLLGFTFAMAASRFEARKELVRDEANAIGTAYLRSSLLPEPQRANVRQLMRQYVDNRFELQQATRTPDALAAVNARTSALQDRLWAEAMAAADRDRTSVMTGLFVASLNDMIDMHGKQLAAMRNRIPFPIFALLVFVAIVAVGLTGYGSGPRHSRNLVLTLLMSMLIAAVIMLIVDLHRPTRGNITLDLSSFADLRDGMAPVPAAPR